jgi:hypothetical protein
MAVVSLFQCTVIVQHGKSYGLEIHRSQSSQIKMTFSMPSSMQLKIHMVSTKLDIPHISEPTRGESDGWAVKRQDCSSAAAEEVTRS